MRIFKKETGTVEIPFDRYEELVLVEQRYGQAINVLQSIGAENQYGCSQVARQALSLLGEDVFAYKNKEEIDGRVKSFN